MQQDILYVGTSAGSCICCPHIGQSQRDDDPTVVVDVDYTGLGLVPFYIDPHCGEGVVKESTFKAVRYCEEKKLSPYMTLSDQQAIVWEDGKFELIDKSIT